MSLFFTICAIKTAQAPFCIASSILSRFICHFDDRFRRRCKKMREDRPGRVLMTLKLATFLPNAIVDSLHATAIPRVFGLVNENASQNGFYEILKTSIFTFVTSRH
jgi:hypothetical protein